MGVLHRYRDVLGEAAVAFASDETGVYKSLFSSAVKRVVDDHLLANARVAYALSDTHDAADYVSTLYSREAHRAPPTPAARGRRVAFCSVGAFPGPDVRIVNPGGVDSDQDLALCRFGGRHVLPVLQLLQAAMA